jgi:hypothetical protein
VLPDRPERLPLMFTLEAVKPAGEQGQVIPGRDRGRSATS